MIGNCEECGKEVFLPFECNFCGSKFCVTHRLPENHSCSSMPRRTPLGRWEAKFSHESEQPKRGILSFNKAKESKKQKPYTREAKKQKSPIRDYKFHDFSPLTHKRLVPLIAVAGIFVVISITTNLNNAIYFLATIAPCYPIYKLFIKASKIRVSSDLRLFGLRILAGLTLMAGIFSFAGAFISYVFAFKYWTNPLFISLVLFFTVFGLGLMLLGSYLLFRFKLKSGVIIYRG